MEMEPIGAYFDEECESSLSRIFSSGDADHFMAHLYGANYEYGNTFSNNGITSSNFLSIDETNVNISETESAIFYNLADSFHTNFHHFSKENSYSSGSNTPFFPTQSNENYQVFRDSNQMQVMNKSSHLSTNISSDEFLVPSFPHRVMEEFLFMTTEMVNEKSENDFNQASNVADLGEEMKLKRGIDVQEHEASGDEKKNYLTQSPKKKPRVPIDAQKGKRNALSKKNKNISLNGTDKNNVTIVTQNHSSSCSSEDDNSNIASQDSKGEVSAALNSGGKTRARRGAATDPQSLYARRRRERINERLRILQNLVPNGTKVDISTMLEEAVHYVKFLQLQIRLLSSDELWMFAPIAYNGMDMGLYHKISI